MGGGYGRTRAQTRARRAPAVGSSEVVVNNSKLRKTRKRYKKSAMSIFIQYLLSTHNLRSFLSSRSPTLNPMGNIVHL